MKKDVGKGNYESDSDLTSLAESEDLTMPLAKPGKLMCSTDVFPALIMRSACAILN